MHTRKKDISVGLGVFIILISILVVCGWILHIPVLKSGIPGFVSMKFNTAVCFGLLGTALLFAGSGKGQIISFAAVIVVALVSAINIFEYIFHWNTGLDQLLWKEPTADSIYPGRTSLPASINFLAIAVVLLMRGSKRTGFIPWTAIWMVFLFSLLSFLGYLFGIPYLHTVPALAQMALPTAILFMLLAYGIYFSDRNEYLEIPFRKKLIAGFLLIMLVFGLMMFIYGVNEQRSATAAKWVEHTDEVIQQSEETIFAITSVESAVRGYLVTQDESFLPSVEEGRAVMQQHLDQLSSLTQDNPQQQQRVKMLSVLVAERIRQFNTSITIRNSAGYRASEGVEMVQQGTGTMTRIRLLTSIIQEQEKALLEQRKIDNRQSTDDSKRIIYFFGFVMLVILIVLLVLIVRNINARIRAEQETRLLNATLENRVTERTEELLRSESKFHYTLDAMMEGAQIIDFDWKYIYVNDALLKYAHFTRDELIGKTVMERYPGIESAPVFASFKACMYDRKQVHMENEFLFPDGSVGWYELSFQPIPDGIFILSVDVTEKKRSEAAINELNKAIAKSEWTYRLIASSIPGSVICLLDTDLRYFLVEGDLLEPLGYVKENLLGNRVQDILPAERYAELETSFKRVLSGESFMIEETRKGYDTLARYVPLQTDEGHVYTVMIVVFDITQLKVAQRSLANLNQELEQRIAERTEQLASANKELESFSYSVSHDLRAPLRGIDGWSLALIEDYGDQLDEKAHQYLGRVRNETQRMGELIDDMLKLSRVSRTELKIAEIDISALAEAVTERMREENPARVFEFAIQPGLRVHGDANLLDIMLTNLLSNACKFTARVSPAKISFGQTIENGEEAFFIKDNGAGFNMDNAKNLFGAFQRMHRQSEFPGSGIGLATVQRIVHLHHGRIWAEAVLNQGATFYFILS